MGLVRSGVVPSYTRYVLGHVFLPFVPLGVGTGRSFRRSSGNILPHAYRGNRGYKWPTGGPGGVSVISF